MLALDRSDIVITLLHHKEAGARTSKDAASVGGEEHGLRRRNEAEETDAAVRDTADMGRGGISLHTHVTLQKLYR